MSQTHSINRCSGLLLALFVFVQACATKLPSVEKTKTMKQIFEQSVQPVAPDRHRNIDYMDDHPARLTDYSRSIATETSNLFEWLPNPTLFYFVFPHTKGSEGLPVPGYTVPFSFYESNQFALPGEVVPNE